MAKEKVSKWDMAAYLKSEKEIAEYLDAAMGMNDPEYLPIALGTAARARGMLKTSQETKLDRSSLYRALAKEGDPRLSTLSKVASTLGYRITLVPIKS